MRLTRWPLWLQLTSAMALASIGVALVAGNAMRDIETDYLRDELRRESLRASQALTTALAGPVAAGNESALRALLARSTWRDDAHVHSLALIDAAGRTVSRWVASAEDEPGEVLYFSVATNIPGSGQGQLVVSWKVGQLVADIQRHVERIRLNVFFTVGLLSGVLVVLVHFLVMRPVDSLRRGLDALSRGESGASMRLSALAASELNRLAGSLGELGRYQRELRETQASLEQARHAAEAASEAKGRFLAVMTHEIRTPINGVIGSLDLLVDDALSATQRSLIANAQRAADSLLEIINEILDFSRVESGRLQLEAVEFALEAQINDVAGGMAGLIDPQRVELVVDFDPALPERVCGDPLRLRQVLTNLLGNAAKFTEDGAIVLRARAIDGGLRVEVTDTGVGIAREQQSALFQPFTQADSSTSRRYGGTGLGLSIVKQLVELMGGRIGIESAPGRGSTFWLEMPLVARSAPGVRRAPALDAALVLLIEDQDCARGALAAYLASFGMQVLQAADAAAALACVRETPRRVAYLVLDAGVLAAGGGAALIDLLRADAHEDLRTVLLIVPGIPVADDLPVDGAVLKPVTRAELLAALAPGDGDETHAGRSGRGAAPATTRRVLLVDDNPMNLQVAAAMLERLGLAVDSAASGEEALASLAERRYDVVLMDEQMPGMDGREATRRLREREGAAQRTPVLALTANADAGAEQRCLDAGMDAYLAKPVRRSGLRDALLRWIPELRA